MTSSMFGLSRSSTALPKTKPAPKKVMVTVWCRSDPLLLFFLILKFFFKLEDNYYFAVQLSEFWHNHYIWDVCSTNWWDALKTTTPAAGIVQQNGQFSMTMPDYMLHNQRLKSWTNWAMKFCLIHYIHLASRHYSHLTSSSISTIFWRYQKHFWYQLPNQQEVCCFQTSGRQKMLSKLIESWSTDFYTAEISKLISRWQTCVDPNGSYFD